MCSIGDSSVGDQPHRKTQDQFRPLSFSFKWFDEVSSTSDVAKELAESGAAEGTVVVAKRQTAGRGRHTSRWFSPEGGLYFTVVLRPQVPASHSRLLAITAALAVADTVELATLASAQLKWPNDIYVSGKKVGGVLIETHFRDLRVNLAHVGIGVNVSRPDDEAPRYVGTNAIWLSDLVQKAPDITELLTAVLGSFTTWYQRLQALDCASIMDAYNRRNLLMGRALEVRTCDGVVVGRSMGIDSHGSLVLEDKDGAVTAIIEGEVCSWS